MSLERPMLWCGPLSVVFLVVTLLLAGCGGGSAMSNGNATPTPSAPSPTITSVTVICTPSSIQTGQTSACAASVSGTGSFSTTVTWNASAGTISSSGILTAPSTPQTVTVMATSTQDSAKRGGANVTVAAAPSQPTITSVTVLCQTPVQTGATSNCTATVTGTGNFSSAVTWGASAGSISANGLLIAPATPQSVTVTATSVQDATKNGSTTVVVTASSSITSVRVSCQTPVQTNTTSQCAPVLAGTGNFSTAVTWMASAGGISTTGVLAAPDTAQSVTVTATSVQDTTKSGSATVTVTAAPLPMPAAPIVLGTPPTEQGYGLPVIAADANGNIDVAWVGESPFFARSTDGGKTFTPGLAIPPNNLNFSINGIAVIQMSLDAQGDINLMWSADVTGAGTAFANFFSRSVDGGQTFSAPVNVVTTAFGVRAKLAVQPHGTITVVWFDQTTSDLLAARSTDGVNFSNPTTVWTAVGNPMDLTALASPKGPIYVFWTQLITMSNCSILVSSSADGSTFTPTATISRSAGSCNQTPSATVDSNGNLDVAWDADGSLLFFNRSTDEGATFSMPTSIPTSASPLDQQIRVGADGTIYIAWDAQGGLFSHSDDNGATFSSRTTLSLSDSGLGCLQFGVDSCKDITVIGQGGRAVSIVLQRSTDDGLTFTDPITLSDFFYNYDPRLVIDSHGNVGVVYDVDGPPDVEYVRVPTTCSIQ